MSCRLCVSVSSLNPSPAQSERVDPQLPGRGRHPPEWLFHTKEWRRSVRVCCLGPFTAVAAFPQACVQKRIQLESLDQQSEERGGEFLPGIGRDSVKNGCNGLLLPQRRLSGKVLLLWTNKHSIAMPSTGQSANKGIEKKQENRLTLQIPLRRHRARVEESGAYMVDSSQ